MGRSGWQVDMFGNMVCLPIRKPMDYSIRLIADDIVGNMIRRRMTSQWQILARALSSMFSRKAIGLWLVKSVPWVIKEDMQ